jgi:hypothetical protein
MNGMGAQESTNVGVEKRVELFQDYIKTVLNLATGALVVSVTFLHEIIGLGEKEVSKSLRDPALLGLSWTMYLVSVMGSLLYLYFLSLSAKYPGKYSAWLKWGAMASVFGFVTGVILFAAFGWLNLPS